MLCQGLRAAGLYQGTAELGNELVLHVPLCEPHKVEWEGFASCLRKARERSARAHRDTDWLLDSAIAVALFPPGEPL
jgi:hypothetical protein